MGPTTTGSVCNLVQSQTSPFCVTGSRSESLGSGHPESPMGGPGCLSLSTNLPSQPGSLQGDGPRLSQNDLNCTRLAKHALVLGSSQSVGADSLCSTSTARSGDTTIQWTNAPGSQESEPSCMAPRASTIQEQGFSDEVAARIGAPQRLSTRAVYKSKWAIFVKWCRSHVVDFRSPSVTQIADFLLHLFQDRNLHPSTIEGYKTAIADIVGKEKFNISKDENLTRLLDSFHKDKPKGRWGYQLETSLWCFTNLSRLLLSLWGRPLLNT